MQVACIAVILPDEEEEKQNTVEPMKSPGENYVEVTDEELPF
jgi:hypothetical protein